MINKQIFRLLGKLPTLAACAYRHRIGRSYNYPSNDLEYTENFLFMLDRLSEGNYRPNPVLTKALDVIFILHADRRLSYNYLSNLNGLDELNCSTAAMRQLASTGIDPYMSMSGKAKDHF